MTKITFRNQYDCQNLDLLAFARRQRMSISTPSLINTWERVRYAFSLVDNEPHLGAQLERPRIAVANALPFRNHRHRGGCFGRVGRGRFGTGAGKSNNGENYSEVELSHDKAHSGSTMANTRRLLLDS